MRIMTARHTKRYASLRAYREATGKTQEQLAAELGITQSGLSRIEKGLGCSSRLLKRIVEHTGVQWESLVSGKVA